MKKGVAIYLYMTHFVSLIILLLVFFPYQEKRMMYVWKGFADASSQI